MNATKSEVVSLKVHRHLRDRLDRFRSRLRIELKTTPGVPNDVEPKTSDALNALIDGALDEAGRPTFEVRSPLGDSNRYARALRMKIHEGRRDQPLSFRPKPPALSKLDGFVSWLSSRSLLEHTVTRSNALRTLMFGLHHTHLMSCARWRRRRGA